MKVICIFLVSACLVASGCTTTRWVPLAESPETAVPAVQPGEKVTLTFKSSERIRLKVSAVDAGTLTGERLDAPRGVTVQVALADLDSISATRFSAGRTLGLVGGVVGGVLLLAVAALYASVHTCEDCMDP